MPANRNNNNNNQSSSASNAHSFFSSIIQSTPQTGNQRIPMGTARSNTSAGSWIISELQQAQHQIERTLQEVNTRTIQAAPQAVLDPTATPFYLHPRQSTQAELLEGPSLRSPSSTSAAAAILSPHTIQAARAASTADDLIERYLEAAMADNEAGSETESEDLDTEMDAFMQPTVHTINPAVTLTNSLPIQLQQVMRNATNLHRQTIARNNGNAGTGTTNNSALRNKIVYRLQCLYCTTPVCERAMRAILLADTKIELYSTDIPPRALKTMDEDRLTQGCNCRIRDTVCTGCGNVLGYHVSQPCDRCLDARNNGHFWMFYSEGVSPAERKDVDGSGPLFWASLTPMCEFVPASACANRPGHASGRDTLCR